MDISKRYIIEFSMDDLKAVLAPLQFTVAIDNREVDEGFCDEVANWLKAWFNGNFSDLARALAVKATFAQHNDYIWED